MPAPVYATVSDVLAAVTAKKITAEQAEVEIKRLSQADGEISFKVGEKGGLVIRLGGKFHPLCTLYRDHAEKLFDLDNVGKVHAFLKAHPEIITSETAKARKAS